MVKRLILYTEIGEKVLKSDVAELLIPLLLHLTVAESHQLRTICSTVLYHVNLKSIRFSIVLE
jgi:hypothetical protein